MMPIRCLQVALAPADDGSSNGNGHGADTAAPPTQQQQHVAHNSNGNGAAAAVKALRYVAPAPDAPAAPAAAPSASASAAPPAPAAAAKADEASEPLAFAATFVAPPRTADQLLRAADSHPMPRSLTPAAWMLDRIKEREGGAERSLMHRCEGRMGGWGARTLMVRH
jgi:hypothetical protein